MAVELVGLGGPGAEHVLEVVAEPLEPGVTGSEAQVDGDGLAGPDGVEAVPEGALAAVAAGVDRLRAAVDDPLVDRVLRVERLVGGGVVAEDVPGVGLVVAEEGRRRAGRGEDVAAEEAVGHLGGAVAAWRSAVATDLAQAR